MSWESHGCLLHEVDGTVTAYRDGGLVGCAFPRLVAEPGGVWFVRFRGVAARRVTGRDEALRELVGCAGDGCGQCE